MRFELLDNFYKSKEYMDFLKERVSVLSAIEKSPIERMRYFEQWREDPIAFIEMFGYIKVPEYQNAIKPFKLFEYQKNIIIKIKEAEDSNLEHEILIDKPRGMGATWVLVWYEIWRWVFRDNWAGFNLSRTEAEVDDGSTLPDGSIFGKMRWSIQKLPDWLREGFRGKTGTKRGTVHDMSLRILNPANGASLIGSTTNSNAGRSRRYSFIFVDECFAVERFSDIWRALQSVARVKVFASTVKQGKTFQDFKDMCEQNGDYISLSWKDNPFKDQIWYEEQIKKAEFDPEVMKEIEVDYSVNIKSQYYPEIRDAICVNGIPYNRKIPIYMSMDFGVQDRTVLIWFQWDGGKINIINAYCNSRKPLDWYVPFMNPETSFDPEKYNEFQQRELSKIRTWDKPRAYFGEPAHLQRVMPLNRSIQDELLKYKIRLLINGHANEHAVRRHAVSTLMKRFVFDMSVPYVGELYDALANSRYANSVRSVSSKATTLKPVHDTEISDYRSAFENFCVNFPRIARLHRDTLERGENGRVDPMISGLIKYLKI